MKLNYGDELWYTAREKITFYKNKKKEEVYCTFPQRLFITGVGVYYDGERYYEARDCLKEKDTVLFEDYTFGIQEDENHIGKDGFYFYTKEKILEHIKKEHDFEKTKTYYKKLDARTKKTIFLS